MTRIALPLLALTTACSSACSTGTEPDPAAEVTVHAWTSGADGFHTTSWWLDTGAEVVVFDAQFTPELAADLLADIAATTDSPVTTLVVTHPNPDKFNGAPVFQAAGAEVVASAATAAAIPGVHAYKEAYFVGVGMFAEGAYPAEPTPDRTFTGSLELELDGLDEPLVLQELSQGGVATTQTVGRIDRHVFVGDLVAADTHAWLEGGIMDGVATPDLAAWDASLAELHGLVGNDATVYAGRGAAARSGDVLPDQRAYLADAEAIVRAVLADTDDPTVALTDDADATYAEITARLEAAWPGHAHAYLVTYGVYGLAWAIAGE